MNALAAPTTISSDYHARFNEIWRSIFLASVVIFAEYLAFRYMIVHAHPSASISAARIFLLLSPIAGLIWPIVHMKRHFSVIYRCALIRAKYLESQGADSLFSVIFLLIGGSFAWFLSAHLDDVILHKSNTNVAEYILAIEGFSLLVLMNIVFIYCRIVAHVRGTYPLRLRLLSRCPSNLETPPHQIRPK